MTPAGITQALRVILSHADGVIEAGLAELDLGELARLDALAERESRRRSYMITIETRP